MAKPHTNTHARYRRNPPFKGQGPRGRKVFDEVNGFVTLEDYLITDVNGFRVDGRYVNQVDWQDYKDDQESAL